MQAVSTVKKLPGYEQLQMEVVGSVDYLVGSNHLSEHF